MDINTEILIEINNALWLLVCLVGTAVTLYVIKTTILSIKDYRKLMENRFYETTNTFFENGDYAEVTRLCEEKIRKQPKDAYGYWFMGKAQYELGNYENALSNFKATLEIHPSWEKDWVQPYYEKIEHAKQNANHL